MSGLKSEAGYDYEHAAQVHLIHVETGTVTRKDPAVDIDREAGGFSLGINDTHSKILADKQSWLRMW